MTALIWSIGWYWIMLYMRSSLVVFQQKMTLACFKLMWNETFALKMAASVAYFEVADGAALLYSSDSHYCPRDHWVGNSFWVDRAGAFHLIASTLVLSLMSFIT